MFNIKRFKRIENTCHKFFFRLVSSPDEGFHFIPVEVTFEELPVMVFSKIIFNYENFSAKNFVLMDIQLIREEREKVFLFS